ncbi:hypothetical protein ACLB2K_030832 [Fragaria x ananassa]
MSNHLLESIPFSISKPPSAEKGCKVQENEDKAAPENAVTYVYQAKLSELYCSVTATWEKDLTNHSLCIEVAKPCQEALYICKIDLNSCQLWGKKGLRDLVTDAYNRTRSKPAFEAATLMYKKEYVCGRRLFCSKAMLGVGKEEHDIVIETSLSGLNDPEMWITIDAVTIRIMNLNWRFRGNESLMLHDFPVEIFWDVHDWLFSKQASGQGLFIFKPGRLDWESSRNTEYDSPKESSLSTEFCLFFMLGKLSSCSLQIC